MANGDDDSDSGDHLFAKRPAATDEEAGFHKPDVTPKATPADPNQQPQTTQLPSQQKEANQDLSKDDSPNPLLEETMKQAEASRKRADDAQKTFETIQGDISRLNDELKNYKPPEPPKLRPYPQYPGLMGGQQSQQGTSPTAEQQDKRGNLGQIMMQAATLIAIGSAVFGRHRNPYSSIVQQSALGGFFQGIAQGRKDIASEQLQNYSKAVEMTDKLNKQDIEDYHNAVTNNRLTMADQHLLLSDISAARSDTRMYNAAATKDFNEMLKVMEDQVKARSAWARSHLDLITRAENKFLESQSGLAWSQIVKDKYHIDVYKNKDELHKGFDAYPLSKWQADRRASGSVDTEEETPTKTGGGSSGAGNSKADPIAIQEPEGDAQNQAVGNLPSGTFFTVPGDSTVYRKR